MSLSKPKFACAGSSSSGISSGSSGDASSRLSGDIGSPIGAATALKIYKKVAQSLADIVSQFEGIVGDRATSPESENLLDDAREMLSFYEQAWTVMHSLRRSDMQTSTNPVSPFHCVLPSLTISLPVFVNVPRY